MNNARSSAFGYFPLLLFASLAAWLTGCFSMKDYKTPKTSAAQMSAFAKPKRVHVRPEIKLKTGTIFKVSNLAEHPLPSFAEDAKEVLIRRGYTIAERPEESDIELHIPVSVIAVCRPGEWRDGNVTITEVGNRIYAVGSAMNGQVLFRKKGVEDVRQQFYQAFIPEDKTITRANVSPHFDECYKQVGFKKILEGMISAIEGAPPPSPPAQAKAAPQPQKGKEFLKDFVPPTDKSTLFIICEKALDTGTPFALDGQVVARLPHHSNGRAFTKRLTVLPGEHMLTANAVESGTPGKMTITTEPGKSYYIVVGYRGIGKGTTTTIRQESEKEGIGYLKWGFVLPD